MMPILLTALLLALLPGMCSGGTAAAAEPPVPVVQVENRDGIVVLNLRYRVPVSPAEAWDVLTDFENMPAFIPNLDSSRVLLRNGSLIHLEQKGRLRIGMLPISYESTRQLETIPYQSIRAHSLPGNTRMESLMLLTRDEEGTLISYHVTAEPDLPVPTGLVSSYISGMLESQFKAMGREMMRRTQLRRLGRSDVPDGAPERAGGKTRQGT